MPTTGKTKYQPLLDFLATQNERDVTLTFAEIEAIIGVPLPRSAFTGTTFWGATKQMLARRLHAMGWDVRFDYRNQCAHFTRDAEDQLPPPGTEHD